jgi:O-antigen/teichoic acid export membrane protein
MKFNIFFGSILLISILLLPYKSSLLDISYCYLVQNTIGLIYIFYYINKNIIKLYPLSNLDLSNLKKIIKYGCSVHFTAVGSLAMDPIVRWLIGNTAGVMNVGYYDIASRISAQIRGVIVSANQLAMPIIAIKNNEEIAIFYKFNFLILKKLLPTIYFSALVLAPLISIIFYGKIIMIFLIFLILILISNLINLYTLPSYFINVIKNKNYINSITLIATLFLTISFTYIFNIIDSDFCVLLSQCLSIVLCSIASIAFFNNKNNIKKTNFEFGLVNIFLVVLFYIFIYLFPISTITLMMTTVIFIMLLLFVGIPNIHFLNKIYQTAQ